jgi:hypothetical protein
MKYVENPNIPENKVELAIIDGRIDTRLSEGLSKSKINIIKTKAHPSLYASVAYHPDMFLHHLGGRDIVYAPGTDTGILHELEEYGFRLIRGDSELISRYPGDISYNVARIGRYAFHNTKYTDKTLKDWFFKYDVELIHVNQGYAKCAISIVDENSIITMDRGIAGIAEKKGFDVLIIEEKDILLPGLDNGFIGGSTGLIHRKKWAIAGDITALSSYCQISDFLKSKGIEIISLSNEQVVDIGSLLPIAETSN